MPAIFIRWNQLGFSFSLGQIPFPQTVFTILWVEFFTWWSLNREQNRSLTRSPLWFAVRVKVDLGELQQTCLWRKWTRDFVSWMILGYKSWFTKDLVWIQCLTSEPIIQEVKPTFFSEYKTSSIFYDNKILDLMLVYFEIHPISLI